MTEATEIKRNDSKSVINLVPTPLNAEELAGLDKNEKISEMEKKFPHLKNCIFACGGTCIVYYADERKYLVKQLYKSTNNNKAYLARMKKINDEIASHYQSKGGNYFLRQILSEIKDGVCYEVFVATNGSTIGVSKLESSNDFIALFKAYKGFLKSLEALHEKGYIHFDVKPDNIFKYKANETDSYTMQLFDFGSTTSLNEVVKNLQSEDGEGFVYGVTPGWYETRDINKYCEAVKKDDSFAKVLDTTAAVKVLLD